MRTIYIYIYIYIYYSKQQAWTVGGRRGLPSDAARGAGARPRGLLYININGSNSSITYRITIATYSILNISKITVTIDRILYTIVGCWSPAPRAAHICL